MFPYIGPMSMSLLKSVRKTAVLSSGESEVQIQRNSPTGAVTRGNALSLSTVYGEAPISTFASQICALARGPQLILGGSATTRLPNRSTAISTTNATQAPAGTALIENVEPGITSNCGMQLLL